MSVGASIECLPAEVGRVLSGETCPFLHPAGTPEAPAAPDEVRCGVRFGRDRVPSRVEVGCLCRHRFRSCLMYRAWREITGRL